MFEIVKTTSGWTVRESGSRRALATFTRLLDATSFVARLEENAAAVA